MYKNFKITEEEKKQILESHMSHGYKKPLNESSNKEYNQIDTCASMGIKTVGYCDTQGKKPVKSCAELGVKTPGYCYVDTKQPVPNMAPKSGNSIKEDDSNNQNSEEFIKVKFFDKRIEEFEDEIINLIEDAKDNFYNLKDVSFDVDMESSQKFDKLVGMIVNKIEGFADELRMEYLDKEPSDDQIMNQPGSEGGVSYKSDDDNFQGR
jgi:hypothetical protein